MKVLFGVMPGVKGSGTFWRRSGLFLAFVQIRKESTSVEKKERVLTFSGEKTSVPRDLPGAGEYAPL